MEINPISSGTQTQTQSPSSAASRGGVDVSAVRQATKATAAKPEVVNRVTQPEKSEFTNADQRRYESVERGAQAIAAEMFAVSDTRFTIYKDTSGQFITRFTSLQDGTVTYFPEPEVAAYMEQRSAERQAAYDIDA